MKLAVLLVMLAAGTASAEDVQGVYDVKYEQMSSNCNNALSFKNGELKIDVRQKSLVVNIDTVPQMVGIADSGKINAVTKKVAPTLVAGMDGKFSVAGRVQNGILQLVFVGEYSAKGKALCTQSWNITGARRWRMRTSGLGLVVVMMGCGPGDRAAVDAGVAPCTAFDLTLPATGNFGGTATGFVWTGGEYLVLFSGNAVNATLVAVDPLGAVRWTHPIEGQSAGPEDLAWDGHRAAVARTTAMQTTLVVTTIDPDSGLETDAFETSADQVSNSGLAGTDGRFAITWVDTFSTGRHFMEMIDGQLGPIVNAPSGGQLWSFIATPTGYALAVRDPDPGVLVFDRAFTPQRFAVANDVDLDTYGPMLAATDDDVVAVQSTRASNPAVIDVDFVTAGRRIVLPLQFANGMIGSVANATVDRGIVYVAANEFDATTNHVVGTIALGADGVAVPRVLFSDPLLTGVPRITKDVGRTGIVSGRGTQKPSFTLTQRCE